MKKQNEEREYRGVFETSDDEVRQFLLKIDGDDVSLWISDDLIDVVNNADDYDEWGYPSIYYENLEDYRAGKSIALQIKE